MPEPVEIPSGLANMGNPDAMWIYRRPDGAAYGAIARWNKGDKKEIRPIIWNGSAFVSGGFGDKRPLLNSDLVSSQPVAPVLIVEGEKTLDAASQYAPEGWVVVTWAGGAGAWDKSDWSVLAGHTCVIWPDNDEPGLRAASSIQVELTKLKIPTAIARVSHQFPEGWDLADELPVGNAATITQMLRQQLKSAIVIQLEMDPIAPAAEVDDEEDDHFLYRACGHDHGIYYIMPTENQQVLPYSIQKLGTEDVLIEIVNDVDYWATKFPGPRGRVDLKSAQRHLKRQCTNAGIYSSEKIRQRGVWSDEGRVVLNTGENLFLDGNRVNPVKIRSKFIYPLSKEMMGGMINLQDQAPDNYGRLIRDACSKARWSNPIHADLLAGWIATAIVCGGIDWRTHIWLTGNHGSGKSTVINQIVRYTIGDLAIYPVGKSTEAGIRQTVGNDAIPVVFDESEGDKDAEEQRASVIQLMRQSSSDTAGRIMKGSANHTAVSFTLRSAFMLSSIGVGLKEAADLSRTAVLTLRPLDGKTIQERDKQQEEWKEFLAACVKIPKDTPHKLLARQVSNLNTLRSNIEVFKDVIAVTLGNRRLGDQLGTLLAGNFSLISTNEINNKLCEKYLENYNWSEFTTSRSQREDLALIYHLMTTPIKVETNIGGPKERVVGELIELALQYVREDRVSTEDADMALRRHGLRVDKAKDGLWIATSLRSLEDIMSKSDYPLGWLKVLERHPRIERSDNALKFSGASSRALFLPRTELIKAEG
jgi:putative DNA primase/helicase